MIPYGRQDISQADIDAVVNVLRSDFLTQGEMVPRFEKAIENYATSAHAVAVNSATSALHIACLALGVGPGDWVWTSPNTFVASANCSLYCGAKIDFVDIDSKTYNISVEKLEEKLYQANINGRLPKVLIPVHFAGQPCDMHAIHKLSCKYGFKIIEDGSHAIGAFYRKHVRSNDFSNAPKNITEKIATLKHIHSHSPSGASNEFPFSDDWIKVGSCAHSDITVFSFHPVKIITTGEGGLALTNDANLYEKMCRLRTHGITNQARFMDARPTNEIWNYQQIDLGFNYRMTDIQAALGLSQLGRLENFVERRYEVVKIYEEVLRDLAISLPWQAPAVLSSYHLYPIRVPLGITGKTQREIYDTLRKVGIGVNLHYIPVHRHPYYEKLGFKEKDFPEAEAFHKEAISLPIHTRLSLSDQLYIINAIKATVTA